MFYDLQVPLGTLNTQKPKETLPSAVKNNVDMAIFAGVDVIAMMTEMPNPVAPKYSPRPPEFDLSFLQREALDGTEKDEEEQLLSAAKRAAGVPNELALWAAVNRPSKAGETAPLLHVLHRLHNPCLHASHLQAMQQTFPSFHLLSVSPQNLQQFHQACSAWEIDLITLDVSSRLPYQIKHTSISCALQRGIYFEIPVGKAFVDAATRRNTIAIARDLVRVSKGKNIILTTGGTGWRGRGVADLINFATLFGMSAEQARDALTRNPRACILHGQSRRATFKGVCSTLPPMHITEEETTAAPKRPREESASESTKSSTKKSKKQ